MGIKQIQAPDWPLPPGVKAITTTRSSGFSLPPFDSFNTASHVGDIDDYVAKNRAVLSAHIGNPICWLDQVHGTKVLDLDKYSQTLNAGGDQTSPGKSAALNLNRAPVADAAISQKRGGVCAVQTADCLPVLISDKEGKQVAAAHAGWRGLAEGIISKVVKEFASPAGELTVWLGPAISQDYFEVGEDVYAAFRLWNARLQLSSNFLDTVFVSKGDKYLADIYRLAREELNMLGVQDIYGGTSCTWREKEKYFSYRREGVTGRMTSAIWIVNQKAENQSLS